MNGPNYSSPLKLIYISSGSSSDQSLLSFSWASSMAASRQIFRSVSSSQISRRSSSSSSSSSSVFNHQSFRLKTTIPSSIAASDPQNHEFSKPCDFIGSWTPPTNDPKEAEAKLVQLRRDYAKQVKELRKEYLYEMDLQRMEKQRKYEAKQEAIRIAKEERKAAKAAMAEARAAERKIAEEEFRQTLMKERQQNLENWRLKEEMREEKKKEKNELLRRQSSVWISETDLEKKILEAIVDSTGL